MIVNAPTLQRNGIAPDLDEDPRVKQGERYEDDDVVIIALKPKPLYVEIDMDLLTTRHVEELMALSQDSASQSEMIDFIGQVVVQPPVDEIPIHRLEKVLEIIFSKIGATTDPNESIPASSPTSGPGREPLHSNTRNT